jgi:hypothetical protein
MLESEAGKMKKSNTTKTTIKKRLPPQLRRSFFGFWIHPSRNLRKLDSPQHLEDFQIYPSESPQKRLIPDLRSAELDTHAPNTKKNKTMNPPSQTEIAARIGASYSNYERFLEKIGDITTDWKQAKSIGWFQTIDIKKKRIYYFLPEDGGFTFRMVFNEKAIEKIREEKLPEFVIKAIDDAKKYPEGKPFDLKANEFDVELAAKLVSIKLESMKYR